ncbi:MAG: tRNA pseudouridine(38-40) synthase TruA [Methanomassiliicoccaceae archaeon]|nr:tRNA pseudouridine(38-40) synthase TruA [Methanomassiliicoccaceae archaeon]
MIRAAVKIAYLGEHFSGSQMQPGVRTVAGDVLSDLERAAGLGGGDPRLRLASRTDKGVNALGNVAVFDSGVDDPAVLLRALNAVSEYVFYRGVALVGEGFNPRFADNRAYRYVIPSQGMDVGAMGACAEMFAGEHDFARFCRQDGRPTTLTMDAVTLREGDGVAVIDFSARYYLWNLIRRIAAAVMAVGKGDATLEEVRGALCGDDLSFGVARPDALTLMDVRYGGVEFAPAAGVSAGRVEEGMFRNRLRGMFLESL